MNTGQRPTYRPAGDAALVVEFGNAIDPALNRQVRAFAQRLEGTHQPGITDIVPTYRSVLIHYDPLPLSFHEVMTWARAQFDQATLPPHISRQRIEIATIYGGEDGPDLEFVAHYHNLSPGEIIRLHSSVDYTVYMMGFMPGFPYLGGLPLELETPRLETPRTRVPAGSVGLAGKQTGIYPLDSPGGWRIIGRTSVRLFDPTLDPPALLSPGDQIRFVPMAFKRGLRGA